MRDDVPCISTSVLLFSVTEEEATAEISIDWTVTVASETLFS
jgi:hypothetical protein